MNNRANVPLGLRGDRLTEADYRQLEARWITPEYAHQAFLRRVDAVTGAEELGRNIGGDYGGILIPYIGPGEERVREVRLRLDHPEMVIGRDGTPKPGRKYIAPAGRGNMLYFVPGATPELLSDTHVPIVITEGAIQGDRSVAAQLGDCR